MYSLKLDPRIVVPAALCVLGAVYLVLARPGYLTGVEYLGGLLLLEILAAIIWNYRQRFFPFLILAFLLAGTAVPLHEVWTSVRWAILGAGAVAGAAIYLKEPFHSFRTFHLAALFCVVAAAASAVVSPYPRHALLKALSLFLLFVYCACGGRLALQWREEKFISGLLVVCELFIYCLAVQYFIFHFEFFGNPNSLGAVMGVALAPLMLWGILVSEDALTRRRRIFSFLLSLYLLFSSHARAGISAAAVSCILLCIVLARYRMLIKGLLVSLMIATLVAAVAPLPQVDGHASLASNFLLKGKKQGGVFGSRKPVWDQTITSIKQHPWLGGGFGTEATGYDANADQVGSFSSNTAINGEHGSSYLALIEGVGLLGVLPFAFLLFFTVTNVGRVIKRLAQTKDPFSPAVPLAAVLVAGLVHAMFEDWLFAVGYYLCVFFWTFAFMLQDAIPLRRGMLAKYEFSPVDRASREAVFIASGR